MRMAAWSLAIINSFILTLAGAWAFVAGNIDPPTRDRPVLTVDMNPAPSFDADGNAFFMPVVPPDDVEPEKSRTGWGLDLPAPVVYTGALVWLAQSWAGLGLPVLSSVIKWCTGQG